MKAFTGAAKVDVSSGITESVITLCARLEDFLVSAVLVSKAGVKARNGADHRVKM